MDNKYTKEEISIQFAEWVGINTFDGRYMKHDIGSTGIHSWRLYNESDYIYTHILYQKFCYIMDIDFTIDQKILYWDKSFEPTNFIEYIGKLDLFYYRSNYNGVPNEPYWTKYNGKGRFNSNDLYITFKSNN